MDMKKKEVTVAIAFCPPLLRLVGLTFFFFFLNHTAPIFMPYPYWSFWDYLAHIFKFSEFYINFVYHSYLLLSPHPV